MTASPATSAAPQSPPASEEDTPRWRLCAGTGTAVALLVFSRPRGAIVFGAGDLKLPLVDVEVPLPWVVSVAPVLILSLWLHHLRESNLRAGTTALAAVATMAALAACLWANVQRAAMFGAMLTLSMIGLALGAAFMRWIRRDRQRAVPLHRWGLLAGGGVPLLSLALFVLSPPAWVDSGIEFRSSRIEAVPAHRGFRGANLFASEAKGLIFDDVSLIDSDLRMMDLTAATIARSQFVGSQLQGAKLNGASLREVRICALSGDESCPAIEAGPPLRRAPDTLRVRTAGVSGAGPGPELAHAHLTKTSFQGVDLRGADLSGIRGEKVTFHEVDLRGAKMAGMSVSELKIHVSVLRDAQLAGHQLSRIDFDGSDLGGAVLTGANLGGSSLRQTVLDQAVLCRANLHGAHLEGAHLTAVMAQGVSFEAAHLEGSHLDGADLRGANLQGADLTNADLTGADLTGADLQKATLASTKLDQAKLQGARLPANEKERFNQDTRATDICFDDGELCSPQRWEVVCPDGPR